MAGGIFTNRPFEPNPKCMIFSFGMIAFYWFSSNKPNIYLTPIIFVIAYVGMAWYDWIYNCDIKMYSGKYGIASIADSIFKPQRRNDTKQYERDQYLLKEQEEFYKRNVYLFHIIMIMPILIYIGYKGAKSDKRSFSGLFALGIFGMFYHFFRFIIPRI